jgi:hypothetical protein
MPYVYPQALYNVYLQRLLTTLGKMAWCFTVAMIEATGIPTSTMQIHVATNYAKIDGAGLTTYHYAMSHSPIWHTKSVHLIQQNNYNKI